MKNKNNSRRFFGRQPLEHMTKGPAQDYPPDWHPRDKKIKVKGGPLSKDQGQAGATIEKVEGTIVIELSNRGKTEAEYPSKQPHY
jgi:hypothetical protein